MISGPVTIRRLDARHTLLNAVPEVPARLRDTVLGRRISGFAVRYETGEHAVLSVADLRGLFLYRAMFANMDFERVDLTDAHCLRCQVRRA